MSDREIPVADTTFRELYEECKLSKLSDMEKQEYEKSILEYDDVKDAIEYNRKLSREEGRMSALLQVAKNFLALGVPMADVVKATGLTEEQIQAELWPLYSLI